MNSIFRISELIFKTYEILLPMPEIIVPLYTLLYVRAIFFHVLLSTDRDYFDEQYNNLLKEVYYLQISLYIHVSNKNILLILIL